MVVIAACAGGTSSYCPMIREWRTEKLLDKITQIAMNKEEAKQMNEYFTEQPQIYISDTPRRFYFHSKRRQTITNFRSKDFKEWPHKVSSK
jgi:hypothetical protein